MDIHVKALSCVTQQVVNEATFQEWASSWTELGLGLSLWDADGRLIEKCSSNAAFWQTVILGSEALQKKLSAWIVQASKQQESIFTLEPGDAVHMMLVRSPVSTRNTILVATALGHGMDDHEQYDQFCDEHDLDVGEWLHLAEVLPRYTKDQCRSYRSILSRYLEARSEEQLSQNDVNELSTHLAQAYEELNLIYRISADLTVSKPPADHLAELTQQLAFTTVLEGYAAVLDSSFHNKADPHVIVGGQVPLSSEEILRLYRQAQHEQPTGDSRIIIVNDADARPDYAWLDRRVCQFALFPLQRKRHEFGAILAINREDGKDLCSEEIRLVNSVAERGAAFLESAQLYDDLEQLFMGMLHALVSSIDAKDPYTSGHSQRVAWLSRHIGQMLGMDDEQCQRIYLSGLLHDIGKIGVPESVLCKAGRLTPDEFAEIKKHPEMGAKILEGVRQVDDLIPGILYHHERYGGGGYPSGIAGENIPLLGRIICLADSFDAMTTSRTYRSAQDPRSAAEEIRRCGGTQFDPRIVACFLKCDFVALHEEMRNAGCSFVGPTGIQSLVTSKEEHP